MVTRLEFAQMPALVPQYLRILVGRKKGLQPGASIPRIEAVARGVRATPERLAAFRRVCAVAGAGTMPPTFPQILVTPLHTAMLTSPAFPLPILGLVHVRNTIVAYRPIPDDAALDLNCHVEGHREVEKGIEVDLVTEATLDGATVWESVASVLVRKSARRGEERKPAAVPTPGGEPGRARSVVWKLGANLGRVYARVAGDYNPIHQYAVTARLFGFPRAIVHGMWSLARCLAEVEDELPRGPSRIEAAFKRPVLLPSRVLFTSGRDSQGVVFELRSPDGAKPHLAGRVTGT